MGDTAIRVENLTKEYRLGTIGYGTLREDLQSWWARVRGKEDPNSLITKSHHIDSVKKHFLALDDISFEVKKGDRVGIIGKNGAGKSTLLKILSQITSPTKGNIYINGRIGSLLEVGTGFHQELTGRENIYLNGAILGMKRWEIEKKLDEIVDFAGIERFLDTPVKRYSSGMFVRLGFAVAAHLEPEVLIVDEVLAVGDAEFQKKAIGKMEEISSNEGRTVLFVSHNLGSVSNLCNKGILLQLGKLELYSDVDHTISRYLEQSVSSSTNVIFEEKEKSHIRWAKIMNQNGAETLTFDINDNILLEIEYYLHTEISGYHTAIIISDLGQKNIYSTADTDLRPELFKKRKAGYYHAMIKLPLGNINCGKYLINVGMGIPGVESFERKEIFTFEIVDKYGQFSSKEGKGRAGLLLHNIQWEYAEKNAN